MEVDKLVRVSELGEFGLVRRLSNLIGPSSSSSLVVDIGDDAAVWRSEASNVLVASVDSLVEDVHFLKDRTPWSDLGWKALASSISDIMAMGGKPDLALVAAGIPISIMVEKVDDLYVGLQEAAKVYGVTLAGGDVVRSDRVTLTVTILGHAELNSEGEPLLLRRDRARSGQFIAVTGTLGDAAAGLRLIREGLSADNSLIMAHLRPHPPVEMGQQAARLGVDCGVDVSDGLLQDLSHICRRSVDPVGARLWADSFPLSRQLLNAFPEDAMAMAAGGGEDYELVLVAPMDRLRELMESGVGNLTIIGAMEADTRRRVRIFDGDGRDVTPTNVGWDHLSLSDTERSVG